MEGRLMTVYYLIEDEVPSDIIMEFLAARMHKIESVSQQRYEIAAKYRSTERDLINKYSKLSLVDEILGPDRAESVIQEIRDLKIKILLK